MGITQRRQAACVQQRRLLQSLEHLARKAGIERRSPGSAGTSYPRDTFAAFHHKDSLPAATLQSLQLVRGRREAMLLR